MDLEINLGKTYELFSKYKLALYGAAPLFVFLSLFTLGVIALYSRNYLSQETGKGRYWMLYSLFASGVLLCGFAGNLQTFFIGWEMVGLASFFLIGFYQSNTRSLENSLVALANYKMCDIFFVLAIFLEEAHQYQLAGASLIIATLAKSAQFPFSSWLYRALEGPTPSSTVFYGGLSLHLGAFLLIQQSHLWETSPELRLFIGVLGSISVVYGLLVGSTRSDIKTSFAFASISQVGLIYVELALGLYNLALWHIVGHNILRTWNYLRAASFFDDFFRKDHHSRTDLLGQIFERLPQRLYIHAFNGFYLDRIFMLMRNGSLIFFLGISGVFAIKHLWEGVFHWEYLLLFTSTFLAVRYFVSPREKMKKKLVHLFASQILVLLAIHLFYIDFIEETYFLSSLLFLIGVFYSLRPSLQLWVHENSKSGDFYLGQAMVSPRRHQLFLFCCISLTASPGSLQFFLQETLFDDLWNRSHSFMVVSLVCLTLNSFHFFRLGQQAFLGERRRLHAQ